MNEDERRGKVNFLIPRSLSYTFAGFDSSLEGWALAIALQERLKKQIF
ncbi:hypothetical protein I4641_17165 [Waterburya agarophytonicola K14]|uniref:Uncharacterized protein n=1 Tax=Waterburya agarophytonicola KI4 TaxID=2874699 RepID=A0A964BUE2_9CYAN|nr:hypothetical protein [Waterburya agarophytonicola]MCC0178703.1 hypothetical protein [Waterburya agarophytonicola KI4]